MLNKMVSKYKEACVFLKEEGVIGFDGPKLQMLFSRLNTFAAENELTLEFTKKDDWQYPYEAHTVINGVTFFALVNTDKAKELNLFPEVCPVCGTEHKKEANADTLAIAK